MFKQELAYLFLAIEYYTRLSKPIFLTENIDGTNRAIRFYPIVGGIIGLLSAIFAYLIFIFLNSGPLFILGALLTSIIITGAMHEKGFARFCDGMGEGKNKDTILNIMNDIRINTYGLLGLLFLILWKFFALSAVPFTELFTIIFVGQIVSRSCAGLLTAEMEHINSEERKPLFTSVAGEDFSSRFYILLSAGVLALVGSHGIDFLHPLIALILFYLLFKNYIQKKLDGYTDDCVGACQQLAELVFYISCISTFK
ncbi:MAG: hypothetical protein COA79_10235 [Planctomycetota bacterium]|nr:MAG: hypothetical protein COA79_10235 [Planctomycetota bacterium]